jgi:hypothetical protein
LIADAEAALQRLRAELDAAEDEMAESEDAPPG